MPGKHGRVSQKRKAAEVLADGGSMRAAGEAAGVSRTTVLRWKTAGELRDWMSRYRVRAIEDAEKLRALSAAKMIERLEPEAADPLPDSELVKVYREAGKSQEAHLAGLAREHGITGQDAPTEDAAPLTPEEIERARAMLVRH